MKSQLEKLSPLQRKLNVEVTADSVQLAFESVYKNIQRQAHIKGFRKGKAPLAKIRSLYEDQAKEDVLNNLIQKHYIEALREHEVQPLSYPEFEFDQLSDGQPFKFSAAFEIRPEVRLLNYEGLEVEKEKYEFKEEEVDKVLENIRNSRASNVPVLEDRPAQKGDIAVIDFEGFIDGAPLEGGQGQDHQVELGSGSLIPGFEEGIEGMTIGGQKTLQLKFPDEYHAQQIAGKPVEFKVTLKKLEKRELPELTDEFIKTLGGPASLEDLKKSIRDDIQQSEQKRVENDFKNRLLKVLVRMNPVDVPPSMLEEQKKALIEDFRKRSEQQGLDANAFEEYKQKWDADFTQTASEMIQSSFLVDTLAQEKELYASAEDIEAKLQEYANQTGIELARIKEFYGKDEQQRRLSYQITEEKVIKLLMETAKVKEVPKEELTSLS